MKKLTLLSFLLFLSEYLFPCTVVYYKDKNVCLAGNNEDSFMPYTQALFLPEEKGKFGRVFFGYYPNNCNDFGYAQGGMNDKGLFFDGCSLPYKTITKSANKPTYFGNLMVKILEECSTVDEALVLIEKYNLGFFSTGQMFIGDKNGNAAIIEGDTIIRKSSNWLVATNFRLSEIKGNQFPCLRYKTAKYLFESCKTMNVDYMRDILSDVRQEGECSTIYSYICDFKNSDIYIYHFHNFNHVVKLSLTDELKKGKHTYKLASLFPENPAYIVYEQTERKAFDNLNASRQNLYKSFREELLKTYGEIKSNIKADSILDLYSKVTGGKGGREYVKTLIAKGTITSKLVIGSYVGDYTGTLVSYKNSQGKYFERVDLAGLIIIEKATDGKSSWQRNSYQSYKLLNGSQDEDLRINALIESNYRDLYKKLTFLGTTDVEGQSCYKILFETNSGYQIAKYFNKITGLQIAQLSVVNDSIDGPTKTWTIFDDYNNDMLFPNTIKLSITTQTPFAIQTSNLDIKLYYLLNAPVDESLFNLPLELSNFK